MKTKFLIAAACLTALTMAPASAQLLGGGGGLGGSLGGALGGSGGLGGSLGGALGGAGHLDRSIDLDDGRVGASGSHQGRASAEGATTRKGKTRSTSGSAESSASGSLGVDTLGVSDARNAVAPVRDRASDTAGTARDRATAIAENARSRATNTVTNGRDRVENVASQGANSVGGTLDNAESIDASGQVSGSGQGAASTGSSGPDQAED